jgi:hypothetical protein
MESIKQLISLDELKQFDRGTLTGDLKQHVLQKIKLHTNEFASYEERVGIDFLIISNEIKRYIDQNVTDLLNSQVRDITDNRFTELYFDVRLYPRAREFEVFDENLGWVDSVIDVNVFPIICIPKNDKLDIIVGSEIVNLFSESLNFNEHPFNLIKNPECIYPYLNIAKIAEILGTFQTDTIEPCYFNMSFETEVDALSEEEFLSQKNASNFRTLIRDWHCKKEPHLPKLSFNTENYQTQTFALIAALAHELGVKKIDPNKLERNTSLHALMEFNHTRALSLTQSIKAKFDVVVDYGGHEMITVGNALDFVQERVE